MSTEASILMIDRNAEFENIKTDYLRSRYLRNATEHRLQSRWHELAINLWKTDENGNVTRLEGEVGARILTLMTHILIEKRERDASFDINIDERAIRDEASKDFEPIKLDRSLNAPLPCFAKFGQADHIRRSLEEGVFRIAPAASYNDPSLNSAQADEELSHYAVSPTENSVFKLYMKAPDGSLVEAPVEKKETFRYMNLRNFYTWCCSYSYDSRLFHDFKADAVLIIRDISAFEKLMNKAVAAAHGDAFPRFQRCMYYDSYTIEQEHLVPMFSKNIKFLYQNEFRFTWAFRDDRELKPFFIRLGDLSHIAEVAYLT